MESRELGHWCELASDAILCLNERWEILFANRAAIKMFPAEEPIQTGNPAWQWPILLTVLGNLHLDALKSAGDANNQFRTLRTVELPGAGAPPISI